MPIRRSRASRLLAASALLMSLAGCQVFGGAGVVDLSTTSSQAGTNTAIDRGAITEATGAREALEAAVAQRPAGGSILSLLQQSGSGTCLPWRQARADTLLRLHTQFLVTSLTCDGAYGRPDLYNDYRRFTATHADALGAAEQTTATRLNRDGTDFDSYRTGLANTEAQLAGDVGAGVYCAARQARLRTLETGDFQEYATALTMRQLSSLPNCDARPR